MALKLLVFFVFIPLLELLILMQISMLIGPFLTIILVVLTAFAGATIAKIQGFQAVLKIRENMKNGIIPGDDMVDAFLIFVAGVLLILPGIISDICGIFLLFPKTRDNVRRFSITRVNRFFKNNSFHIRKY